MEASRREIEVGGRKVALIEAGSGPPLVYLHGFADVHGVAGGLLPFHEGLAQRHRVIAPAHPGCNGSGDFLQGNRVDDFLFHCARCSTLSSSTASRWSAIAPAAGSPPSSRCAVPSG